MNRTYTAKTRPFTHQIEALRKSRERKSFAYFMEMGTGKSKTLIDDIGRAFCAGEIDCVIIFANKGSYANWHDYEIPIHLPDDIPRAIYIWRGDNNARDREFQEIICTHIPGVLRFVVMNIEAVGASDRGREFAIRFTGSGRVCITVDESTLIKNHDAVRTKFLIKLGGTNTVIMKRILTGTPITKDPLDLWGQFLFLGKDLLGFNNFYSFRARYAILQEMRIGRRTIVKPVAFQNLDELEAKVLQYSFRVLKEDCLDLPEKIYTFRDVEMTEAQKKFYDDMKFRAVTDMGDINMTATTAMVKIGRLQQILSGWITDDDTKMVITIPSNRVQAVIALVEESVESVIIWCAYRMDVKLVSERLREEYPDDIVSEYHGGIDGADREIAVRKFQNGESRFFVSTAATGGRGITLTKAGLVIYYSNSFDLEMRLQSEDRAHRIGQTKKVQYVDLRVKNTVDAKIVAALRKKIDIASSVMGDGLKEWLV